MSNNLKEMDKSPQLTNDLPLGFARVFISEAIILPETMKKVTLDLPKYRHNAVYIPRSNKPISKLEL